MKLKDRTSYRYSLLFVGFDSFVGNFVRVLQAEGLVELRYRFCSSGHGKIHNELLYSIAKLMITYSSLACLCVCQGNQKYNPIFWTATWFQTTFSPAHFHYIARVNRLQYGKLQKAVIHKSFDPNDTHEVSVASS